MKTARFLLSIAIAAVSLQGAGFARQSSPASQQVPSQSGDKAAEQQINDARNGTDEARQGEVDQKKRPASQTRNTTKRRPSVSASKAAPHRQMRPDNRPASNKLRGDATGGGTGLRPTGSKAATAVSGKATGHRSPPVPPPSVSVNGQHFRNSRDPGARLAVSGGPLTATGNTGAINGTNMRRRP